MAFCGFAARLLRTTSAISIHLPLNTYSDFLRANYIQTTMSLAGNLEKPKTGLAIHTLLTRGVRFEEAETPIVGRIDHKGETQPLLRRASTIEHDDSLTGE